MLTFLRSTAGLGKRSSRRGAGRTASTQPAPHEALESRVLPAVNLFISYQLDNGFFASADRRAAMEAVAAEIETRLNDTLAPLQQTSATVTNPSAYDPATGRFGTASATLSSAPSTLTIFVGSASLAGSTVGIGGWRTNTGIRNFSAGTSPANYDFQPYVGYVSFDNATTWNFSGTGSGTDFRTVARHELLHVLGLGGASSWDAQLSGGVFTGQKTRTANGGASPGVTSDGGHFVQTVNSIMRPVVSEIRFPTAVDWAALDDIGWDVTAAPASGTYADVFGRNSAGAWYVSQNLGTSLSEPVTLGQWAESAGWQDVSTGDFNADGRTDVAGRTSSGEWYVGLNTGGAFSNRYFGRWAPDSGNPSNPTWRDVRFGDFNADGRTDVAGRASSGEWYVGLSDGVSFDTSRWARWNEAAGWQDMLVADFDGDRRSDIAGRSSAGEWYVARSTGAAFATGFWATWNEQALWRDVLAADFDGNGRADLAGRTAGGEWYVGLSLANLLFGNVFSTLRWDVWNEAAGWRGVTVGNFAGDSRPDLVGRTATGQWYVAVNVGGNSLSTIPYGAWTEGAWQTVLVGDFAGSAATADVLARSAVGTWLLGENNGSQFVFRTFGQWNEGLGWRDVFASKRVFTSGAGATALGTAPALSVAGVVATPSSAASPTTESTGSGALLTAATGDIAPSRRPAQPPALSSPKKDEPSLGARLATDAPKPTGVLSLLDVAFGDGRLLDALVAAG